MFKPSWAIPPGETLKETVEFLGLSREELAKSLEISLEGLDSLFEGVEPINQKIANRLERATGVSATFWKNLERYWREKNETY